MDLKQNIALAMGVLSVFTFVFFIVQRLTYRYYPGLESNIAVAFIVLFAALVLAHVKPGSRVWAAVTGWLSVRNFAILVVAIALTWLVFFIVKNPFTGFLLYRKLVLTAVLVGIFFMLLVFFAGGNDDDGDNQPGHHSG